MALVTPSAWCFRARIFTRLPSSDTRRWTGRAGCTTNTWPWQGSQGGQVPWPAIRRGASSSHVRGSPSTPGPNAGSVKGRGVVQSARGVGWLLR
jgi:hypothetical protein